MEAILSLLSYRLGPVPAEHGLRDGVHPSCLLSEVIS